MTNDFNKEEHVKELIRAAIKLQINHAQTGKRLFQLVQSIYIDKFLDRTKMCVDDGEDIQKFRFMDKLFGLKPGNNPKSLSLYGSSRLATFMCRFHRDIQSTELMATQILELIGAPGDDKNLNELLDKTKETKKDE